MIILNNTELLDKSSKLYEVEYVSNEKWLKSEYAKLSISTANELAEFESTTKIP